MLFKAAGLPGPRLFFWIEEQQTHKITRYQRKRSNQKRKIGVKHETSADRNFVTHPLACFIDGQSPDICAGNALGLRQRAPE